MTILATTSSALQGASPLPTPRGPLSEHVLRHLRRPPGPMTLMAVDATEPLVDDDLHLALYLCYELHYAGLAGVDERWEWEPSLLAQRRLLEAAFEGALRDAVTTRGGADAVAAVEEAIGGAAGPSLSTYMLEHGTLTELREFAIHRSLYQLKEADPHTWAIPRLRDEAKAALVLIQGEEYGDGRADAMHATLFAKTMRALGLDDSYGAYLDSAPGCTLATVNLVSLFGLHRRLRGALVGHLAMFEMTSVEPMGRYARALWRLGLGAAAAEFYDVHVVADAEHELVARAMVAALSRQEPALVDDIEFGARALCLVEDRFARHLLEAWAAGRSSLR